jgi:hypothetical protein
MDVNKKHEKNGHTLLHCAAELGNLDVVKMLVENGADVDAQDVHGATPLFCALSFNGNEDVVAYLIQKGADINHAIKFKDRSVLKVAIKNANLAYARMLCEAGADTCKKTHLGYGALHSALERLVTTKNEVYREIIDVLCEHKALESVRFGFRESVFLEMAISAGCEPIAKYMLESDDIVDKMDEYDIDHVLKVLTESGNRFIYEHVFTCDTIKKTHIENGRIMRFVMGYAKRENIFHFIKIALNHGVPMKVVLKELGCVSGNMLRRDVIDYLLRFDANKVVEADNEFIFITDDMTYKIVEGYVDELTHEHVIKWKAYRLRRMLS